MRALRIDAHNGAPVWGGAEIAVARLMAGLHRRGHDVLLHCNHPEVARRAAALGAPARRTRLGGDIALHDAARLALLLRRRRPDALLVGTFRKLWLAALAARLGGVPRVVARIGLETDMPRSRKYRYVLRRWVDAVAFNADAMRIRFQRAMPEYPGTLVTIRTGIPAPPAARGGGAALRASLGVPATAALIGSVGRLARQKRYDRFVRVLAALPGVHGVIAGDGPERAALEAEAVRSGVASRLHLIGHREDVGPVLAALDVFVLCSDREGLSNAMVEALWAGVPVVSTDVSGAAESLEPVGDGDAAPGVVVGAGEDALLDAVRRLLADPGLRERMGGAAVRAARERFEEERMLDDWERLLRGDA